jgi:hypothetical protein
MSFLGSISLQFAAQQDGNLLANNFRPNILVFEAPTFEFTSTLSKLGCPV